MAPAKTGRREATDSPVGNLGPGIAVAHCLFADRSRLPGILRRLRCSLLAADCFETAIWIFRLTSRSAGRCPIHRGPRHHADQRVALRQNSRKTLACCRSSIHQRSRVALPHRSSRPETHDRLLVQLDQCVHGVSSGILGDPNGTPERINGCHYGGNDQCGSSIAGFAGPYAFGYLHNRNGSASAGFAVLVCSALAAAILMLLTPTGKAHTALD